MPRREAETGPPRLGSQRPVQQPLTTEPEPSLYWCTCCRTVPPSGTDLVEPWPDGGHVLCPPGIGRGLDRSVSSDARTNTDELATSDEAVTPSSVQAAAARLRKGWRRTRQALKEAAATSIQAQWRSRITRIHAAARIQRLWRRRTSSFNGPGPSAQRPPAQRPPVKRQLTRGLNKAASRIQRLWRRRLSSRESVVIQRSKSRALSSSAASDGVHPEESQIFAAASRIQTMWRHSKNRRSSSGVIEAAPPTIIVTTDVQLPQDCLRCPAPEEPPKSPGSIRSPAGVFEGATARLQEVWRSRSFASRSPAVLSDRSADADNDVADAKLEMKEEMQGEGKHRQSFWADFSGTTEWVMCRLHSRVRASREAGEPLLRAWWADRKKRALEHMVQSYAPVLKRMLGDIGDVVKTSVTSDPDMWTWVRPVADSAVSEVWRDIEMEIESSLKIAVLEQPVVEDRAPTGSGCISRIWLWIRSRVLHHYLPHNKSIFGKLKDPAYVLMTASTLLPIFGVRVLFFSIILSMLLIPGPPDEYQLVNFILLFKGTQFFTTGVAMMFYGAMKYYFCYLFNRHDVRRCIDQTGPGATDWLSSEVFDYFGSILLVWIAFLALPRSNVHWSGHRQTQEHEVKVYCCCLKGVPTRGGRLRWLLRYDMVSFVLSFSLFMPIYIASGDDELTEDRVHSSAFVHAKETVFWCRILYSLLSLPFVLFVIPVCGRVLTHSVFTGYNKAGACVEFNYEEFHRLDPVVSQDETSSKARRRSSEGH